MMTIKEYITDEMERLDKTGKYKFIGYNCKYGSKMYGTLEKVRPESIIETPVNEGMMVGMGIGLALKGWKVMVMFERHDFLLANGGLDQIVNHVDKMFFDLPIGIRCIVGATEPLHPGNQHSQNYSTALKSMCSKIQVYDSALTGYFYPTQEFARIFIEYKEDYEQEMV